METDFIIYRIKGSIPYLGLEITTHVLEPWIKCYGQLVLKKTSPLFFLKWFSPTFLHSWIICHPFQVFLYLILLERRRTESLNPKLVWSRCNSELFSSFSRQPGTQKEQNSSVCVSPRTENESWGTALRPVSGFCVLSWLGKENACSLRKSQIELALWPHWPLAWFDQKICEVRFTNLAKNSDFPSSFPDNSATSNK